MKAKKSVMSERQALLMTLLLASLAALPLFWGPGMVNTRAGGDSPFLIVRVEQLATILRSGVFPPRWMPDAAYGYGYPFFNHYAALPYYVAAGLSLLGWGYLAAIKITQTIGLIAAALAMYALLRRWSDNPWAAFLGALAYCYAPFHLVNVYVRGDSLSALYAFIFFPLIIWSLDRLRDEPNARRLAPIALSLGGLVLSHNVSFLIFSPFIGLYLLIALLREPRSTWRWALLSCLGLMAGLAWTSWFWLPAFAERGLGHMADMATGYFHYSGHFRGADLVQLGPLFDYAITADENPFAMGLFQALLAGAGLVVGVVNAMRKRKLDATTLFALSAFLISTWLITPLSKAVWDHFPLLPTVQFPWRFLSIQAFAGALLASSLTKIIGHQGDRRFLVWALGGAIVLTSMWRLSPERLLISEGDVDQRRLRLYEMFTGNIGTTIRHEYLPTWVGARPYTSEAAIAGAAAKGEPLALEGTLSHAELLDIAPTRESWRVEVGSESALVAFQTYYFPGWQAAIDGNAAEASPAPDLGYIQIRIPAGSHQVSLRFGRTKSRLLVEGLSLVSALALIALSVWDPRRLKLAPTALAWTLGCIVALALPAQLLPEPRSPAGGLSDLTMDFARQPYLHHNPEGVRYGDQAVLRGYTLSATEAEAGQTVQLDLRWPKAESGIQIEVHVVPMSDPRFPGERTLAISRAPIAGEHSSHQLTVPQSAAPGVYLLSVRAWEGYDEIHPLTTRGEPLGTTYLQPLYISNTLNQPRSGDLGRYGDCIAWDAVQTSQESGSVRVEMRWASLCQPANNYALSARLKREDGRQLASLDAQPLRGFYPTSFWRPGQVVTDEVSLAIPAGTPPGSGYAVELVLYDPETLQAIGAHTIPGIILAQPTIIEEYEALARMAPDLDLVAAELVAPDVDQGQAARIRLDWASADELGTNYAVVLSLRSADGTEHKGDLAPLVPEYPTARWPGGALVSTEGLLPKAPAGAYQPVITVLDEDTGEIHGGYALDTELIVKPVAVTTAVPPMKYSLPVQFGEQIRLLGYDSEIDGNVLQLALYWQALAPMDADYKVFVHVLDPATEQILAQHDALPGDTAPPTSAWQPGQVVSDDIQIVLGDAGGPHTIALGLYNSQTGVRLPAVAEGEATISADRVMIPQGGRSP